MKLFKIIKKVVKCYGILTVLLWALVGIGNFIMVYDVRSSGPLKDGNQWNALEVCLDDAKRGWKTFIQWIKTCLSYLKEYGL